MIQIKTGDLKKTYRTFRQSSRSAYDLRNFWYWEI